jgi:hypothetical protein
VCVTTLPSRVGDGAPRIAVGVGFLVLLLTLLPAAAEAADWTRADRMPGRGGSRLDSLHQLAADGGRIHLIHPHIGTRAMDDRVYYQRSRDGGRRWSKPTAIFSAGRGHREVVANLALDARADVVAAVWRTVGPRQATLWVRMSRDGGDSWGARRALATAGPRRGIGVPAVAVVSRRIIAVAWTDRSDGRIRVRVSRDGGRHFGRPSTLGRTGLSIDCARRVTDGMVGLTASRSRLYAAWSAASDGQCLAGSVRLRGSGNAGRKWGREVTVTDTRTYGWPELDALGHRVIATVQSPDGIVVARSSDDGRTWRERSLGARSGRNLSAADITLLSRGRALIAYVDERLRRSRLVSTRVLARLVPGEGAGFRPAREVAASRRKLRLAPNVVVQNGRAVVVVQSGPLSGSNRDILVSRQR